MGTTSPYLDRMFSSVRLQYRAIGLLAGFAFLVGTIVEEIYGGRDLLHWFLLTILIAGFFGVALATFRRDITDFQLERLWLGVLLFGLSLLNVLAVAFLVPEAEVAPGHFAVLLGAYCIFIYFVIASGIHAGISGNAASGGCDRKIDCCSVLSRSRKWGAGNTIDTAGCASPRPYWSCLSSSPEIRFR